MAYRRRFSRARRRRARYLWVHTITNNASPSATLNSIDLLTSFRTHAGISINFPAFTIWRIRVKITVVITLAAAVASNDGVVVTAFVDSYDQTPNNQVSNTYDQHYQVFDLLAAAESAMPSHSTAAGTYIVTRDFDLKSHRRLTAVDDTQWLQLAASGQAQISNYTTVVSLLLRESH